MSDPDRSYSPALPLTVGLLALALLVGVIGYWSVGTRIAGAVVARGIIEVESNRQVIQHAEGGTVGKIAARDGDRVAAGDLLVRLDDTLLRSELAVARVQLVELAARRARLEAERDDATSLTMPAAFSSTTDATALAQIEGQRTLFAARLDTLERELTQIGERISQTGNRVIGTQAQIAALETQQRLVAAELASQEQLLGKGLVPSARVATLKREEARLSGEVGELTARVAEFRGQIASDRIESLKRRTVRRENAISELRDIRYRELELTERHRSLSERLARLEMRAPVAGVVYGSTIFAEQAVIQPAEAVMYIVPQDQPLVVKARVDAIHIDQVYAGQPAALRFPAFNQRLTPEVSSRVITVSADVYRDETTGAHYYTVALMPLEEERAKLAALKLVPGMPVETFLRTEERAPLSYLAKPLTDYFQRAFRER
ncbi:MAG: HlyD family type I secretion periplasmic adaptor subunit [Silicimonas sp.]|jgi:HlyD family secretion protein|nr:HlyD family type I secretion periplasmic adaptor subunit [Silicimonas sp.]